MAQCDYERILASLTVKHNHIKHVGIIKPVRIIDHKNINNQLILVTKGQISWSQGNEHITANEGEMLFLPELPELSNVSITYGINQPITIDNNQFTNHQQQYFEVVDTKEELPLTNTSFSYISFNAKVYEAIGFFKFINITPFKIERNTSLGNIFKNIIIEKEEKRLGQEEVLENLAKNLIIELLRYIIENNLFIEQLAIRGAALTDLRLATLFKYIANNISGDLSNEVLARVIGLSKDYIGQYFKNITDMNLQHYRETIRLHWAVNLLKTNPSMKIRAVSKACGFSDLAYFCRKFKNQWGNTAGKMRLSLATRNQ